MSVNSSARSNLNFVPGSGDVTLTGSQTLTNKTISLGSNTISGTLAQFNTAVTDADLVSLAGSETLTNKTLVYPVLISAEERIYIAPGSISGGTINIESTLSTFWIYTSNASANWTFNFRGDSFFTLNSILATSDSITFAVAVPQGATPYRPTAFSIDDTSVTPRWQGGSAPSAGNANSTDMYVFTIIKTAATPTYTVFASQTRFA